MKFAVTCGQQDCAIIASNEFDGRFAVVQRQANRRTEGERVCYHGEAVLGMVCFNAVPAEQDPVLMAADRVHLVEETRGGVARRGAPTVHAPDACGFHRQPAFVGPAFQIHGQGCCLSLAEVVEPDREFEGLVGDRDKGHGGHRTLQEAEARLDGTGLDGEGEPDFVVAAVHVAQALFGVDRDDHLVRAGFRGPPPQTVGASLTGLNRCNEALTGVDFGDRSRSVEHETNVFAARRRR